MINTINPHPVIPPTPTNELQSTNNLSKQSKADTARPIEQSEKSHHGRSIFKSLDKIFHHRGQEEKQGMKTIGHLAKSLEKMFDKAQKVDHKTGEEEIKQGGLRRVSKDLSKLFKGLGMPPQLAKHFSRSMTSAMQNEDVEQIDFSLTATRAFSLNLQQTQQGYLASGDGSGVATNETNSFQIAAVQIRSLDFSLNLRTGDFSYSQTQIDSLSIGSSTSVGLAAIPATQNVPSTDKSATSDTPIEAGPLQPTEVEGPATELAQPTDSESDLAAIILSDSRLLQISRIVQQSAIMQLKPVAGANETEDAEEEQQFTGVNMLNQMVSQLDQLTGQSRNLFEEQVQINNLRVENEDNDDHLLFTLDALAPVGLTTVDETGHSATLYPRDDGSLGKIVEDEVSDKV